MKKYNTMNIYVSITQFRKKDFAISFEVPHDSPQFYCIAFPHRRNQKPAFCGSQ